MTDEALSEAGLHAVSLFQENEFRRIEEEFGYALSHGRSAEQAIEEDLKRELDRCGSASGIDKEKIEIRVSHFEPDFSGIKSLVECCCELSEESGILIELICTTSENIYLEDISRHQTNSKE
ncbi:MAG: hypothetical protein AAFX93_02255 [Verrucomicrobiota bacterium]